MHVPPYNPESSGLVEKSVQIIKSALNKKLLEKGSPMTLNNAHMWLQEIVDVLRCVLTKGINKSPIRRLLAYEPRTHSLIKVGMAGNEGRESKTTKDTNNEDTLV